MVGSRHLWYLCIESEQLLDYGGFSELFPKIENLEETNMSRLHKAMQDLKFDKRMFEWNLRNGHITKEELKKHLEQLPDDANKVDLLRLMEESHLNSDGSSH